MARALVTFERGEDGAWFPTCVWLATRDRLEAKEVPGDPNRTSDKNAISALDSMRFARVPGNGRRPLRSAPDEAIGTRLCPQAGMVPLTRGVATAGSRYHDGALPRHLHLHSCGSGFIIGLRAQE